MAKARAAEGIRDCGVTSRRTPYDSGATNRRGRASVLAITLALFVGLALGLRSDQWRPVGDAKTIVNTRTGETRIAATGESVAAYNSRLARERQLENENKARKAEELRVADDQRRKKQEAQEASRISAKLQRNGAHYHALQMFILSKDNLVQWVVEPFMTDG